ncbi:discoidin, CUB and LCCL domain-containing protein 1 isoform X2 [Nerophis ophidion]|uniref:discoidin, CUB and LCCL domain-containing protein 1 isoform X2 n=1 Tax=Nerophis ophidion TaxID=159077 RepID=UPI002ADF2AC5|nr:discoidin, CUB and LCCL domain-containing protein 1 isoform X2 [Nerophis ophidion]
MRAKWEDIGDAVKSLFVGYWVILNARSVGVLGQEGNGCGHTLFGPESGTLASQNYPGTYPSNTWCQWKLRVPEGRTLLLFFGDFNIESSTGCNNGSLIIVDKSGLPYLGPVCGKLNASQMNMTLPSNEVTITFKTMSHRSGRGFLLSYATDVYPDIISCLQRGSHFSSLQLSVYCPAGCKNVAGDVWGGPDHGYRDTSVLCKSAVHAGVTSDSLGGRVSVSRGKSLTLYESTFSNGILSKTGSLSAKKLVFSQECKNILTVYGLNASSFWEKDSQEHTMFWSIKNLDPRQEVLFWAAGNSDAQPWVELGLTDKSTITGVITTGTSENHIESYILFYSKDRKNWKVYKDVVSREKMVFQAYADGHTRVLNSLFPPTVARFIRLQPQSWFGRASAQIQILGCPVKITPRSHSPEISPPSKEKAATPNTPPTFTQGPVLVETRPKSSQAVIIAVGVVLGLIMCFSCLLAGVWWVRRKKSSKMKNCVPTSCQSFQVKSLACSSSALIAYPLERNIHDQLPSPPLHDYDQPVKMGSTFRPPSDEGYTVPFTFNHYDSPLNLPEYAEPLPPEPEYATPFSEQDSNTRGRVMLASTGSMGTYDCPAHRMLHNGYCTPASHAHEPRPATVGIYAEPTSCDSLLHHKPL